MPARYCAVGDLHAAIDDHGFDLAPLLDWADRDARAGQSDPGGADSLAARRHGAHLWCFPESTQ